MDETNIGAPRCRTRLVIDPPLGETRVVHDPDNNKYFRLGVREAGFLASLDGASTVEQLYQANTGTFSAEQVDRLIAWFTQHGLLANGQASAPGLPATSMSRSRRTLDFLSHPEKWRVRFANPDLLLERHIALVHGLFSRPALACYLLVLLLPLIAFIVNPQLFHDLDLRAPSSIGWDGWLGVYAGLLAVIVVHETAHAVTCKHFGGKVTTIGLKFLYLQPVAFCDVSDSWRFKDVSAKVAVSAAGIFSQMLISSLVLMTWLFTGWDALPYFAMLNTAIAIYNLFPFIKLDGYWMLVHILDEPNLRARSFEQVRALGTALVGRGWPVAVKRRSSLLAFGIASVAAAVVFWIAGLYALYGYAIRVSPVLGYVVIVTFCVLLANRFSRPLVSLVKSNLGRTVS